MDGPIGSSSGEGGGDANQPFTSDDLASGVDVEFTGDDAEGRAGTSGDDFAALPGDNGNGARRENNFLEGGSSSSDQLSPSSSTLTNDDESLDDIDESLIASDQGDSMMETDDSDLEPPPHPVVQNAPPAGAMGDGDGPAEDAWTMGGGEQPSGIVIVSANELDVSLEPMGGTFRNGHNMLRYFVRIEEISASDTNREE